MKHDVFRKVAPAAPTNYAGGEPCIMLVDVGAKDHMVRSLLARGATVRRVPWFADWSDELHDADGVVIGNGPGDPLDLTDLVGKVRASSKTSTSQYSGSAWAIRSSRSPPADPLTSSLTDTAA